MRENRDRTADLGDLVENLASPTECRKAGLAARYDIIKHQVSGKPRTVVMQDATVLMARPEPGLQPNPCDADPAGKDATANIDQSTGFHFDSSGRPSGQKGGVSDRILGNPSEPIHRITHRRTPQAERLPGKSIRKKPPKRSRSRTARTARGHLYRFGRLNMAFESRRVSRYFFGSRIPARLALL